MAAVPIRPASPNTRVHVSIEIDGFTDPSSHDATRSEADAQYIVSPGASLSLHAPGSQNFFYEKAAPSAAAVRVNTAHQPKTMASAVPRFTLLRQVKPMAVRISVHIRKISNEEARP
jgi:hypothetical protein